MIIAILALTGLVLSTYYWHRWLTDETYTTSSGKTRKLRTSIWSPIFFSGVSGVSATINGWGGTEISIIIFGLLTGIVFISLITFLVAWLIGNISGQSGASHEASKNYPVSKKMKGGVRNRSIERKTPFISPPELKGGGQHQSGREELVALPDSFKDMLIYSDEIRNAYELTQDLPAKVRKLFVDSLMLENNKEKHARKVAGAILEKYDEFYINICEKTDVKNADKYLAMLESLGEGVNKAELSDRFVNEYLDRRDMLLPLKFSPPPAKWGVYEDVETKMRFRIRSADNIVCLSSSIMVHDWTHLKEMYPNFRLIYIKD